MAKSDEQKENERTIETLRCHLFDTLEDLRDKQNPMDIDRAKVIKEVAKEIISTAQVDLKYIELTGYGNGKFIDGPARLEQPDAKKR